MHPPIPPAVDAPGSNHRIMGISVQNRDRSSRRFGNRK